jgi:hypothetical protein
MPIIPQTFFPASGRDFDFEANLRVLGNACSQLIRHPHKRQRDQLTRRAAIAWNDFYLSLVNTRGLFQNQLGQLERALRNANSTLTQHIDQLPRDTVACTNRLRIYLHLLAIFRAEGLGAVDAEIKRRLRTLRPP